MQVRIIYPTLILAIQLAFGLSPITAQEIKAPSVKCLLGEPMVFDVDLTNTYSNPIGCGLSPDPVNSLNISLVNGNQDWVTFINQHAGIGGGLQQLKRVQPQKSCTWQFFLDDYAIIAKPGIYTFKIRLVLLLYSPGTSSINSTYSQKSLSTTLIVEVIQPNDKQQRADLQALHNDILTSNNYSFQVGKLAILMRYTDPYSTTLVSDIFPKTSPLLKHFMLQTAVGNRILGASYLEQFSLETTDPAILALIKQNLSNIANSPH